MGELLKKIISVILAATYMTFFGILYTLLHPIAVRRNEPLKKKARQLNIQAAKELRCDANSVFVKLTSGINLHVVEAGDRNAKLIVLLHGFPDCWHCWSGVIPELVKKGYFVVAPDMRGYNLSDKPSSVSDYFMGPLTKDVKELIENYKKKNAIVVGHDWGGVVSWAFADKYPELVEKLVILNAPHTKAYAREMGKNPLQLLSSWYIFWFQIPFLGQNLMTYDPHKTASITFKTERDGVVNDKDKEILACAYAQDGALPSMLNYYKGIIRSRLSRPPRKEGEKKVDRPQKLQVPTLILWGEDDIALVRNLAMCSEFVEKVQVIYVPKCSHWVPYEVPEIVSREVLKFVSA
eukprot:Phypoly_transcript_10592.p1 GENE.Phypoly_transcript_10592~~Phypoly_transcript_10592.p1  ORF type:complete len:350 (+),score=46.43 Phypoly_transcript_10592:194-1243(+)